MQQGQYSYAWSDETPVVQVFEMGQYRGRPPDYTTIVCAKCCETRFFPADTPVLEQMTRNNDLSETLLWNLRYWLPKMAVAILTSFVWSSQAFEKVLYVILCICNTRIGVATEPIDSGDSCRVAACPRWEAPRIWGPTVDDTRFVGIANLQSSTNYSGTKFGAHIVHFDWMAQWDLHAAGPSRKRRQVLSMCMNFQWDYSFAFSALFSSQTKALFYLATTNDTKISPTSRKRPSWAKSNHWNLLNANNKVVLLVSCRGKHIVFKWQYQAMRPFPLLSSRAN